ncbi:(2Fe-2S) ferredoxin domain-containing protein [Marinilabilia rubra]|uniref:Electron transport complex protein RnfG n=1 Tax=Marinilabilia rubra TaxID=2162893 RepID=A0A2U2BCS9_9BACT|nr:(2Fe-2S) ferredoxin domain-containing protein [Marinilabilia rubra]PWE00874.1 electron transport complex protein RnfG [Marinilabilia rubra]
MSNETDITICLGSSCFSRGNRYTLELIKNYLKEHNLEEQVFFRGDLCDGLCEHGPILKINGEVIRDVTSDNVFEILNEYFSDEGAEE